MASAHSNAQSQYLRLIRQRIIPVAERQLGLDENGTQRRFDPAIPNEAKPSRQRGLRSQPAMAELLISIRLYAELKADPEE